jgi:serine/threonine-protein kinase
MSEPKGPESSESIDIGVKPGDVLAGKYQVEQVLGVGGMGVVVAAHHIQLDEKVALKFLLPHALTNAEAIARFEREARAAVKIKSEHVARVSDVGKLDTGSPYMVMEYLEGSDLSGRLEKKGPLPFEEAVDFVLQACEAIAEAHVLGIVHRDLKPANLFCIRRADGRLSIKVLDFGISKMNGVGTGGPASSTGGRDQSMTRTTAIMGSPLYMSPEQMQSSKRVDARSDIWALGVILFELMTGRPPFEAEVVTELVIKIATQQPAAMRMYRPDTPGALEQVVMRCLEKEADGRYRNVGELAVALEPFAPKRSRASVERILGTMEAAGLSLAPPPLAQTPAMAVSEVRAGAGTVAAWGAQTGSNPGKTRKGAIAAVAAGATLLLGLGGIVLLRKAPAQPVESAPAAPPAATASATAAPAAPSSSPTPTTATLAPEAPPAAAVAAAAAPSLSPTPAGGQPAHHAAGAHPAAAAPAHTAAAAAAAAAPATSAAAKVSCTPPYYYDANGTRIFKKECL